MRGMAFVCRRGSWVLRRADENILRDERRDFSSIVSDRRCVVSVNVVGC